MSALVNRFQIIITYNNVDAYMIGLYDDLQNSGASVFHTLNGCFNPLVPPLTSSRLAHNTNVEETKKFVWDLNSVDCSKLENGKKREKLQLHDY